MPPKREDRPPSNRCPLCPNRGRSGENQERGGKGARACGGSGSSSTCKQQKRLQQRLLAAVLACRRACSNSTGASSRLTCSSSTLQAVAVVRAAAAAGSRGMQQQRQQFFSPNPAGSRHIMAQGHSRGKVGQSKASGEFSANRMQRLNLISHRYGSINSVTYYPKMHKFVVFVQI